MIYGYFHTGSGLGNQLHRYVATRIRAEELGCDFSMINREGFKGASFMNLDMGKPNDFITHVKEPEGRVWVEYRDVNRYEEWDKPFFDPDFDFIQDHTIIDGNFEDERYFETYLEDIDKWLPIRASFFDWEDIENLCVIGFRGGEYYTVPELGLPREYFDRAIEEVKKINPDIEFEVHTDDMKLANEFFPDYKIVQNIEVNWRAMRYAKYAIIANSSFYVLPRLLNRGVTIAPRYWNRYNTKKWDYPQNYYRQFRYI